MFNILELIMKIDIREGGEASEGDFVSVSASNLCWNNPCFSVSCFSVALSRDRRGGGIYIGDLGQAEHVETKIDDVGGSRMKRAWVARPGQGPAPPGFVWSLGLVSLTSSPLGDSRDKY
jgi:hypothetical protein